MSRISATDIIKQSDHLPIEPNPPILEPLQGDAVIRVAAYHRRDDSLAVIRSKWVADHNRVRSSIVDDFSSTTVSDLGALDRLPIELLWIICLSLDIRSCFRFRQVNRQARRVVSSLNEYRVVTQHGLETLCVVLRTGISPSFTISSLYRLFCTGCCGVCGIEFGEFLFLPTATRCCFQCINQSRRLCVISLSALQKVSHISRKRLRQLFPVVRTLPGVYSIGQHTRKKRLEIVARVHAVEALNSLGFTPRHVRTILDDKYDRYYTIGTFMVSVDLPLFNPTTTQVQHGGLSCKACFITGDSQGDDYSSRWPVYSRQGYLDHFPLCPGSIKLWQASQGGTIAIDDPEFVQRGGSLLDPMLMGYHKVSTSSRDVPVQQGPPVRVDRFWK